MLKKSLNEIALSAQSKDLNSLISKSRSFIISRARKFIFDKDELEDLTQEVSLKLFEKFNQFDVNKGCFEVWLQTITRNICIDHIRKNKRVIEYNNIFDCNYSEYEIYNQCDQEYLNKYLSSKMSSISSLQQKIIYSKYYNDFSYEEIAEILNISTNYVRVEHFRALAILRSKIAA